jgi:hypothetical protein
VVATATAGPGSGATTLAVTAVNIDWVIFAGGSSRSLIEEICLVFSGYRGCLYGGNLQLAPDEELGTWKTFLFAQTLNDVHLGMDPLLAAQIIGGLPVTNNFIDAGGSENITYGHQCNVEIVPDGDFDVVDTRPAPIG